MQTITKADAEISFYEQMKMLPKAIDFMSQFIFCDRQEIVDRVRNEESLDWDKRLFTALLSWWYIVRMTND